MRQFRLRVLEALELRARQFRSYEGIWPFRVPHEPLSLDAIVREALAEDGGSLDADSLRSRTVLRFSFDATDRVAEHAWEAWVIALPSRIMLYGDDDGEEARVLASVKRGNAVEADGFFIELLAETRGEAFGIEMATGAPDHVRTSIADRDFLADVFVELFEGTQGERTISALAADTCASGASQGGRDFRADVERWLGRVLVAPPATRGARRQPRRRDEDPSA
jgi:hypothetical protein